MSRAGLAIIILLFISCSRHERPRPSVAVDIVAQAKQYLQPPEIAPLRKRLFEFFDAHRHLDSFDYTDDTYARYFGPVQYAPYTATAGHLLHEKQVHALIFYVDETEKGMQLYLKEHGIWRKIFEDTGFSFTSGASYPVFEDWNKDGIKDIIISQSSMMAKTDNYELWLADKSGKRFHYIKEFVDLDNPELDTSTGEINTERFTAGGVHMGKWRFVRYSLESIDDLWIGDGSFKTKDPDSAVVISYSKSGRQYKEIWCSEKTAYKHVPAYRQEDVKAMFSY